MNRRRERASIRYSPFAIRFDHRVVVQEVLVDGTELLHVERRVVDAAVGVRIVVVVVHEVRKCLQELPVGDGLLLKADRLEQAAIQDRQL
ncbi:hypothetical protein [Thermogutta sp.]|uniref:hypothetical protein n=1 Tax=Thermogutta sp. TaxID=1962930 RepID=UPI0032207DFA